MLAVVCWMLLGQAPPSLAADTLPMHLELKTLPLGLGTTWPTPAENPLLPERVALGRRLFFDPILSVDRTVACASCHRPEHGLSSPEPMAIGVKGRRGRRHPPSLINRAFGTAQFWDGRAATLEEQALLPIANEAELGFTVDGAIQRLREDADYAKAFAAAFPDGITPTNLARAIAAFERSLVVGNSRYDQFIYGKVGSLKDQERFGLWLFESRARCWQCHQGSNLTDESFHNTGVSWGKEPVDLGRFEVTKRPEDRGRFKTPTLRGVARTPPYMHDGSLATLEAVVEFYDKGGGANPHLDPQMRPLEMTAEEKAALVAFLKCL